MRLMAFAKASRLNGESAREWLDIVEFAAAVEFERAGLEDVERIAASVWQL